MLRTFAVLAAAAAALAGCGVSDQLDLAQDVAGGPASPKDALFRQANLDQALGAIEREVGPGVRVTDLKVEPRSVKGTFLAGGEAQVITSNKAGSVLAFPMGTPEKRRGVALSKLDTAIPGKLVAQAEKRGIAFATIGYVTFFESTIDGERTWGLYFTDGREHLTADADGSKLGTAQERAG